MADTPPALKTRVAKVSLAGLDLSTPQAMHVAYGPLRATARRVWQGRDSVYEFEGWEVDLARRELRAHGVPVSLGSRAFQILAVLVQSAGELVTKDELMARVWPGAIVEENKLQVHISAVRKALGTDRGTVKTYFGRGYRLVGNWTIRKESTPADPVTLNPNPMPLQPYLTNVPTAGLQLIGRTAAVQHLQEFLSAYRVITLTGPGGIGKTTLALEVARSLVPDFHGDRWLVDLVSVSDPLIAEIAFAIVSELRTQTVGGKHFAETLATCLAARLVNRRSGLSPDWNFVRLPTLGLDRRRLTRVKEYIAANLEGDLAIAHLAKVASLSRFHFARAFKAAEGTSPHQYVSARRLERAKELLVRGDQSLIDIAVALNFSSQANFTRAFHKGSGITPGQYRRAFRPR